MASSGLRIQYTQRPGVSEAAERTALANAYKFVIAARERKVAGSDGGADAG